jgi:uncharacterized protein YggE
MTIVLYEHMNTPTLNQNNLPEFAKYILGSILTAAAVVGGVILTSKVIGPLPLSISQTTTQKMGSFDVSGESELITVPDQAEVSVGITAREATVGAAQDRANSVINGITEAIKALGIKAEDIKTLDYSINPEYDYSSEFRPVIGYNVSTTLRIKTTDLAQVNQIVDTATANGANQVNGIQFSLSEAKNEELTSQARKEAIADAKENAEDLAQLSGMKLGKIINVYEQPPMDYYPPMPYGGGVMMAKDAAETTNIQPGSTTFTYRVTLSYETL